jgi:lipopolysaccharide export system protein LptA
MTVPRSWIVTACALAALGLPHAGIGETAVAATPPALPAPGDGPGLLGNLTFSAQRGPVTIQAQQLEFDYRTRTLVYRGDVTVTQGDLTLRSDRLTVKLDEQASDPVREVVAEGAVRITKGDRAASGGRATFDQAARTVVLRDHAVLREGQNEVAAEEVTVYLDEERSVATGGKGSVRALIYPRDRTDDATPGGTAPEGAR